MVVDEGGESLRDLAIGRVEESREQGADRLLFPPPETGVPPGLLRSPDGKYVDRCADRASRWRSFGLRRRRGFATCNLKRLAWRLVILYHSSGRIPARRDRSRCGGAAAVRAWSRGSVEGENFPTRLRPPWHSIQSGTFPLGPRHSTSSRDASPNTNRADPSYNSRMEVGPPFD